MLPAKLKILSLASQHESTRLVLPDRSHQEFPRGVVYNPSPLFPSNSQGIILPGSSQDAFIFSHPGFIYPQQDSSSAYIRIHCIHIINIHITYIASCISCNIILCLANILSEQDKNKRLSLTVSDAVLHGPLVKQPYAVAYSTSRFLKTVYGFSK